MARARVVSVSSLLLLSLVPGAAAAGKAPAAADRGADGLTPSEVVRASIDGLRDAKEPRDLQRWESASDHPAMTKETVAKMAETARLLDMRVERILREEIEGDRAVVEFELGLATLGQRGRSPTTVVLRREAAGWRLLPDQPKQDPKVTLDPMPSAAMASSTAKASGSPGDAVRSFYQAVAKAELPDAIALLCERDRKRPLEETTRVLIQFVTLGGRLEGVTAERIEGRRGRVDVQLSVAAGKDRSAIGGSLTVVRETQGWRIELPTVGAKLAPGGVLGETAAPRSK